MAPIPAKAISYSDVNLGQATRLRSEAPNLFGLLQYKQAQKERGEVVKRAQQEKELKDLDELMKYDFDAPWNPAYEEIKRDVATYQDEMTKLMVSGHLTQSQKAEAYRKQRVISAKIAKTKGHQKSFKNWYEATLVAEKEQGFDRARAHSSIKRGFYNKKIEDWDEDAFDASFDTADNYNTNVLMENFISNIADNVTTVMSKEGVLDIATKNKMKNFVVLDEEGNIEYKDGKVQVNITPELLLEAKGNRGVKAKIEQLMVVNIIIFIQLQHHLNISV